MKLEPAAHGYGPWALTLAPLLIIMGFVTAICSIFLPEVKHRKLNRHKYLLPGWIVFLASFAIYLITIEETASLWDCAEFIASAYKLQVPHPPGAPLFLMVARIFSFFAFGDPSRVALWINVSSAVSSAFAVMFTFWTVIMLARKLNPGANSFSLIIAGIAGAFSIAFADSFWFSAVEAETYAMATFFLILSFWSILKWQQASSPQQEDRWLIFILYVLGLSVGVHPMSLLVLPAIAVLVVFRARSFSWKHLLIAVTSGAIGILILNHVILFGLPDAMKFADIFFVNGIGLPFYSGAIFLIILIACAGFLVYRWSIQKHRRYVSVLVVGLMYFLIGYSSYFMIIIRSQADPSIDEHNPENLMTLTSYLKRESYGGRPFLFGPDFTSTVASVRRGAPVHSKGDDTYIVTDHKTEYEYKKEDESIFPRMYSNQPRHVQTYQQWTGLRTGEKPRFIDNMSYMIRYQFGHMFFRYFMFNFSGRESDVQNAGWIGPLDAFAEWPDVITNNKAHNNFLMLPLLLGIIGMIYQYRKDKVGFWSVMAFFLFLGLILVFYLNPPPNEPRERDYIYVGAWLAFAIWCGLGSFAVGDLIAEKWKSVKWVRGLAVITLLAPAIMLVEGFDDHDRTGRTLQVDHARNTLASCAPNAILFTGGDNDTFPLWYVQEVEEFRTDVRVIVLSYFNGDWYVDQMKRRMYESAPLPFSLEKKHYRQGGLNDVLPFVDNPKIKGAINLGKYLDLVRSENRSLQVSMSSGTSYNGIPSRSFLLDIDREKVLHSELVPEEFSDQIPTKLKISWRGNYLEKSAFLVLDLIATNEWKRPIYFNTTSLNSISLELKKNVLNEGLVYRLLPIELQHEGSINLSTMFDNLMNKASFDDLQDGDVYYNHEDYQLRILQNLKRDYNQLAAALISNGEDDQAKEVISFSFENLYAENINLDVNAIVMVNLLARIDESALAIDLGEQLFTEAVDLLDYHHARDQQTSNDAQIQYYILRQLHEISLQNGFADLAAKCSSKVDEYLSQL